MSQEEFGFTYAESQIDRQRNPLRRLVKSFYVSRVLQFVHGLTIDLGCGAGQILERLPVGSLGIEVNPILVEDLAKRGLRVMPAAEGQDGFNLTALRPNEFGSLVLSHVLEHFNHADDVLRKLLRDCAELGVSTVIIVVPGDAGYRSDSTHKTFVNMAYLESHSLVNCEGFQISHSSYFPGNMQFIERLFVYHELMVVYKRAD